MDNNDNSGFLNIENIKTVLNNNIVHNKDKYANKDIEKIFKEHFKKEKNI